MSEEYYEEKCLECIHYKFSQDSSAMYECSKGIMDADGCGCEKFKSKYKEAR